VPLQVHSAVSKALQDSGGSLQAVAHMLARMGFAVRLHTSKGGNLDRLRHTYLTAARNTSSGQSAQHINGPQCWWKRAQLHTARPALI
jgi:hypothetical protein